MDLLEYQAKELFRQIGIPVLPSQRIDHTSDLKSLKIPYPVVLKSQVPTGGRGKAGGIKFVENTIDAIAAAQAIFDLQIGGAYPEVLLAEARYNTEQEFYLAVALDYNRRCPVLWGSPQGGIDSEAVKAQMEQVVIEGEFSPFYARRLAVKMGLQGQLIASVSKILEAMYQLFIQQDLDLVEINPLGVSPTGELMALDGKVVVNDAALGRHPDLALLTTKREKCNGRYERLRVKDEINFAIRSPHIIEPEGNIAVLCNGIGLAMATLDLVYQSGGKPASFLNLGEETATICDRLESALKLYTQNSRIKVVLLNILGCESASERIGAIIGQYMPQSLGELPMLNAANGRSHNAYNHGAIATQYAVATEVRSPLQLSHHPRFVLRLAGSVAAAQEHLTTLGLSIIERLDEAVSQAVSLAKPSAKK